MAIRWAEKVLLFKLEGGGYGVDPTPTGSANAILATNVDFNPMQGENVSRNLERPFLGGQPTVPTGLHAILTFSTELVGSGTAGVAPKWGPIARAIGCAQTIVEDTSVAYTPASTGHESAHVYFWIGSTLHKLKGVRGGGEMTLNAQGIPVIRWTLTGLWVAPTESAPATPTLTGNLEPLLVTSANTPTFTVNSVSLVMRSYSFAFGNDVQRRLLVGREEVLIVDRAETINCVVEAVPLTTLNPFALKAARTLVPVAIVHGVTAGNIVTVAASTSQVESVAYQNNQGVFEWSKGLGPKPNAGNDQFAITLT